MSELFEIDFKLNSYKSMNCFNKQKIILIFIALLLSSSIKILACSCASSPNQTIKDEVKSSVKGATAVFAGKVVGFEYRKDIPNEFMDSQEKTSGQHIDYETLVIRLEVKNWWKGEQSAEIFLVTDDTRNSDGTATSSSCDFNFEKDKDYLVYAFSKKDKLKTNLCSRTKLLRVAEEDLRILGKSGKIKVKGSKT